MRSGKNCPVGNSDGGKASRCSSDDVIQRRFLQFEGSYPYLQNAGIIYISDSNFVYQEEQIFYRDGPIADALPFLEKGNST